MSILEELDERRKNMGREAQSCEEALKDAAVASPTKVADAKHAEAMQRKH